MIGNPRLHWAWFMEKTAVLGILTIPDSVVKHLAKCRTLDDLPVEMLPPVRNNQKKQTTKIDAASVSGLLFPVKRHFGKPIQMFTSP